MRACMVSYSLYESDNRVRRYAETLAKQGYEVDAVALRGEGESNEVSTIEGVRFFPIQRRIRNEKSRFSYLLKLTAFFLKSMWFLTRQHMQQPYDLIHVHSVPDFEVFAALYPKLQGAKVILDIHDIVPEFYASKFNRPSQSLTFKLLVFAERLSASFSDHVIASNHIWEKRLSQRSVDSSKLTTIINFPDTRIFRPQGRTRTDDRFIFLYPGSLNYHQGIDLAIRAFLRVATECNTAEFHIYGSGEQVPALLELVKSLGLQDKIKFRISLPIDKIARVMENADVGLVPKRKSGFGNEAFSTKTLEFMSLRVPVIVPDTAIDSYYFDSNVAEFFRAEDEQSLATAMLLLIQNEQRRRQLAANAGEFVKKFTWQANQSIYLDLVNALLKVEPRVEYVS